MPVMTAIVLDDAATPPVSHTFKPMSLRNDIGTYMDDSSGAVKTWPSITISTRPASTANQGHKVIVKITQPLVVTQDDGTCCTPQGAPVPTSLVSIEFLRNSVSSAADANTLLKYLQELVLDPQFTATALGESLR